MIGRVGAVLAQIIKPIAASSEKQAVQSFQRYKPPAHEKPAEEQREDKPPAKETTAQVIPFPKGAPPSETVRPSVPHAFLLLLDALRHTRQGLRRLMGLHAYRAMAQQKNGKRYRKGAMLDRKAQ